MLVLVVNAGSSSMKSQLLDTEGPKCLMKTVAEAIGTDLAHITVKVGDEKVIDRDLSTDVSVAQSLGILLDFLQNDAKSPVSSIDEIKGIGNRVVSGGEYFAQSVLVTDDSLEKVKICGALAPLHNPHAAACVELSRSILPEVPQVFVFDNAFHMTMPPKAYRYAIPKKYYTDMAIRRYGAHGTSHRYAAQKGAEAIGMNVEDANIITCHIGNGGSISAVSGGKCIDTSMGLTPLEGIMMGTRCGSIDPAIVVYIMQKEGKTPEEMDHLMNFESGLLGISGVDSDMRAVEEAANNGNEDAKLALEMYVYRIQKVIGSYFAIMDHTDCVVMTAGIGENSDIIREQVFAGLEHLGMKIDKEKNAGRVGDAVYKVVSADDSKVKIVVVAADEELQIAKDTERIVSNL